MANKFSFKNLLKEIKILTRYDAYSYSEQEWGIGVNEDGEYLDRDDVIEVIKKYIKGNQ